MLTQEELDREYVDEPRAAKLLKITPNQVCFLCSRWKLVGAIKLGTSGWIIPRTSVTSYKLGKRDPKPKLHNKETITNIINKADNLKVIDNSWQAISSGLGEIRSEFKNIHAEIQAVRDIALVNSAKIYAH